MDRGGDVRFRDHRAGIRSQINDHAVSAELVPGEIKFRGDGSVQAVHLHVCYYADDAEWRWRRAEDELRAEWVAGAEEAFGETLVDHRHALAGVNIRIGENAAAQQRNSERLEVGWRDGINGRCQFRGVGFRLTGNSKWNRGARAEERQADISADGRFLHAGNRFEFAKHIAGKLRALGRFAVRIHRWIIWDGNPDLADAEFVGLESRVHAQHIPETAHEQARAHEQNQGESNFAADERVLEAVAPGAASAGAAAFFQVVIGIGAGRLQSGGQAEEKAGADREKKCDADHAGIKMHFGEPRQVSRNQREE